MNFENYIGKNQLEMIRKIGRSREGDFMIKIMADLEKTIDAMPQTYETDGLGDEAPATLHYFLGASDWYIVEKDAGSPDDDAEDQGKQMQAFGFTCLNGDKQNAELGYISIQELIECGVEIDLYYKPEKIGDVVRRFKYRAA